MIQYKQIQESILEWVGNIFLRELNHFNRSCALDPKDTNKVNIAPEPSSSSNVVISNEDDSSVGDFTKDSKVRFLRKRNIIDKPISHRQNTSIEELEERPTANWIRRQLQHFAQVRRDVCFYESVLSFNRSVSSFCRKMNQKLVLLLQQSPLSRPHPYPPSKQQ